MLDFGFYNMDCMEGMKQFPDKYFDLAVVDPPYGDGGVHGNELTEADSEERSTNTGKMRGGVLEQVRTEVRQVQADTCNGRMFDSQTEHGVMRTGGTWAAKFSKKSLRGTLHREKSILTNFSASHGTRLSGAVIISTCRRHGAF